MENPAFLIFLWKLCRNYLPLRIELCARNITRNSNCPSCDRMDENIDHLFPTCSFARAICIATEFVSTIRLLIVWHCSKVYNVVRNGTKSSYDRTSQIPTFKPAKSNNLNWKLNFAPTVHPSLTYWSSFTPTQHILLGKQ
ncbi:hypothetical protein PVK06_045942 [Gossypium arboreum]|uniref:Reverse transcriptase zinc-binding domain-containing protein n=1 Tax=Gossypium arboreum TaxID=29729 RepID=A0ABR0MVV5_GOSAR|nr:hypothetical protein PVK06_045942 [Gossypium arboreum]